jgi:epoxyqueuosine reductase
MAWMVRQRPLREDPARLLPGARAALCVALQYHPLRGRTEPGGDLWPRVARYAHGRDYHDVMGRRLKSLAARIRDAYPGCATRPCVDTAPLPERELAARAGLGAVGKNTNLVDRRRGSWFLLGEVLLTLEATADEPVADLCGRCTRCLDACPTGALYAPYRLDANRCINYWTIEHRAVLPMSVRASLGEQVFGCDRCQEVCPWNRRPEAGREPALALPEARAGLDLAALLELDRDGYLRCFPRAAMKRVQLAGLRRNAAVAMGNRRDPRYLPFLARALSDDEPLVRRHAAWALGRIGGPRARAALAAAADAEPDPEVRREIFAAAGGVEPPPTA